MPVPPIEYDRGDRKFTPEDPCTFVGNCTPGDFQVWGNLAAQWIGAARVAAGSSAENHATVDRALQYWGQLAQGGQDCSALDCHQFVTPLVELTQRARGYVVDWGGEGVQPQTGWDIPGVLFPDIPQIPGLDLGTVVPWLLLGLALLSDERR